MILLNAIYDSYLMYVDEYEYPAFSLMSPYMNYVFMGFGVLLARSTTGVEGREKKQLNNYYKDKGCKGIKPDTIGSNTNNGSGGR